MASLDALLGEDDDEPDAAPVPSMARQFSTSKQKSKRRSLVETMSDELERDRHTMAPEDVALLRDFFLARDAQGVPVPKGGEPFTASVHGPAACKTEIRDLLDGRYELRVLTPSVSGDFRVAVTLFVVAPLALLGWSVVSCRPPSLGGEKITNPPRTSEVALRLMTSYWQASSLLLITVLLNVQESQLGRTHQWQRR